MLSVWGLGKLAKSGHGSTRLHYCDTLHDLNVDEAMAAVGSNNQVDLAVSKGFWVRELETEWQQCADTFQEYFDAKEKEYAAFLGAPSYRGGWGDPGYPEEYVEQSHMEGEYIVIWNYQDTRYVLSIGQEDREVPFVVSFHRLRPPSSKKPGVASRPPPSLPVSS